MSIKGLVKCIIKAAEDAGYEPEKSLYKATIAYHEAATMSSITLPANDMGHFFQRLAAHLPIKEPDRIVVSRLSKAEPKSDPTDW